MIIVKLGSGLGNQLHQYAIGRLLAYKHNTELKLDVTGFEKFRLRSFGLNEFNISATIATPQEIETLKKRSEEAGLGNWYKIGQQPTSIAEFLNYPNDVYLQGNWFHQGWNSYISDIIRKEITLKNPLSPNAEAWRQKILSAECSVSMHFRHGDYVYNPYYKGKFPWAYVPPIESYVTCLEILKQRYKDLTVFVFSDNLPWVKENLKLDVPTEFISGCAKDVEELYLMSLCKHHIKPLSTFSQWASWLCSNPDKKILILIPEDAEKVKNWHYSLPSSDEASCLTLRVPFDKEHCQSGITIKPIFSLLLVVNNDATTILETLNSLLGQDYKYYELIIIDNASTDGSGEICRKAIQGRANVIYKRLESKVNNATAYNTIFEMAQGNYVSFLKNGDRFLFQAISLIYGLCGSWNQDIIHLSGWLKQDENGNVTFQNKKFSEQWDAYLKNVASSGVVTDIDGHKVASLLRDGQINNFLGTKFYRVTFLKEYRLKFDENLPDAEAEFVFQAKAFSKNKHFMRLKRALYIAPKVLHLDVSTEFVEGCASDDEEKVFSTRPSTAEDVQQFMDSLTPDKKEALLKKQEIGVLFDYYNQPKVTPAKSD